MLHSCLWQDHFGVVFDIAKLSTRVVELEKTVDVFGLALYLPIDVMSFLIKLLNLIHFVIFRFFGILHGDFVV